jgi:hypothetical protein
MLTAHRETGQPASVPASVMAELTQKLGLLEQALLAKDPQMPQHLRESHKLLISFPECSHLLEDSEIHAILEAAQQYTQEKIISEKPRAAGGKKKISADEL